MLHCTQECILCVSTWNMRCEVVRTRTSTRSVKLRERERTGKARSLQQALPARNHEVDREIDESCSSEMSTVLKESGLTMRV
jgi:hypothetical protein